MPTTTKGTWTPADNDDWDLTIDLAAMANSIDLWTTGRYEKSGATVASLGTGDYVGQLGYVTSPAPGRAMRWSGSAWVNTPGAGSFSGNTSERTGYASIASEGDRWYDTTLKLWFTYNGSSWVNDSGFWSVVGGSSTVATSRIVATVASGAQIQSGKVVRVSARGIGIYNEAGGTGVLQFRYAINAAPTTSSPLITVGSTHRKLSLTGSVENNDLSGLLTMPSTGILQVALHVDVAKVYSDPWSLDLEVV